LEFASCGIGSFAALSSCASAGKVPVIPIAIAVTICFFIFGLVGLVGLVVGGGYCDYFLPVSFILIS
jgi:hypothetical protein